MSYATVAVVVIAAGFALLNRSKDSKPLARLDVIDASVAVQPRAATDFSRAESGRALAIGDTLRTDTQGRAQVDYAEGSLTRLDRNTTFVVEKLAAAERPDPLSVRLDVGRTWHEVSELTTSGERFEVNATNAVATVRGTVFTVDRTAEGISIFAVAAGQLEVVARAGQRVLLHAGESVTVYPDGTMGPVQPVSFEDLRNTDEWIRFNLGRTRPLPTSTTTSTTTTSTTTTTTSTTVPAAGGTRPATGFRRVRPRVLGATAIPPSDTTAAPPPAAPAPAAPAPPPPPAVPPTTASPPPPPTTTTAPTPIGAPRVLPGAPAPIPIIVVPRRPIPIIIRPPTTTTTTRPRR